jgi:hypothetical protein
MSATDDDSKCPALRLMAIPYHEAGHAVANCVGSPSLEDCGISDPAYALMRERSSRSWTCQNCGLAGELGTRRPGTQPHPLGTCGIDGRTIERLTSAAPTEAHRGALSLFVIGLLEGVSRTVLCAIRRTISLQMSGGPQGSRTLDLRRAKASIIVLVGAAECHWVWPRA